MWGRRYIGGPKHGEYAPLVDTPVIAPTVQCTTVPIHDRAKAVPGDPTHAVVAVVHYYRWTLLEASPESGIHPHYVHQSLTDAQALKLALKTGILP